MLIKFLEGKWKIWFEHPLLGYEIDRKDLEKYPCISFIRNTNKIQQGQEDQSEWYLKKDCIQIFKNIKRIPYGASGGNENILTEKGIFDDTLQWANKGKGSLRKQDFRVVRTTILFLKHGPYFISKSSKM